MLHVLQVLAGMPAVDFSDPELVQVPSVIGLTEGEARAVLRDRDPEVHWYPSTVHRSFVDFVGAEVAVELEARFYCVLDGFISPSACAELQVTSLMASDCLS